MDNNDVNQSIPSTDTSSPDTASDNPTTTPTITSFIQQQDSFIDNIIKNDTLNVDINDTFICSMTTSTHPTICHISRGLPPGPHSFEYPNHILPSASYYTPQEITNVVKKAQLNTHNPVWITDLMLLLSR